MYNRFIIIKDFNKIGSCVLQYTPEEHILFMRDANRLRSLAKSPIQVVLIGGPNALEIYGEYAPYTFYTRNDLDKIQEMILTQNVPGRWNPFIPEEQREYNKSS